MALPIKETPVLYGEDARRFRQRMEEVDRGMHRVSKENYERAKKIYDTMKAKGGDIDLW